VHKKPAQVRMDVEGSKFECCSWLALEGEGMKCAVQQTLRIRGESNKPIPYMREHIYAVLPVQTHKHSYAETTRTCASQPSCACTMSATSLPLLSLGLERLEELPRTPASEIACARAPGTAVEDT